MIKQIIHATPAKATFFNLRVQSFTQLLHVSALLSRHLEGADTVLTKTCKQFCTWYCRDRVSSCNIYVVQQDTQSFSMIEFIHHVC